MTQADRSQPPDRKFAKVVAKELDRRRMRRKIVLLVLLAAAIVLAVLYGTCGGGWGLGGGKGSGAGSGPGSATALAVLPDAGARRCTILIAATGITVDGAPSTREQAVARCKATTGADVIVAGDTRQGDWDALRAALDAAGIEVFKREGKPPSPSDGDGSAAAPPATR
ncbi:MAG: hypothetical protein H6Q90_6511 [Deltaproteobacteria bacterium]|nr:hypothetical protein [Deltaproteobacteria bacterium]